MMLPSARLQVPWYADLVSLVSPCSPFIYMNYLHHKQKQFRFAIADHGFIKRSTYNDYCHWVCEQLPCLQFDTTCTSIEKENQFYRVKTNKGSYLTQKIILGTGTVPFNPELGQTLQENVVHSSAYLFKKEKILTHASITIVGSGQSAAEIFYDLLQCYPGKLNWFTRSSRFFPMDYSKLTLEMSTPDYIDYFFELPERKKKNILDNQDALYKGINQSLLSDIYDLLDELDSPNIHLHTNCELKKISEDLTLTFLHTEMEKTFTHQTSAVILATGYAAKVPDFIKPLRPFIRLDQQGLYKPHRNYSIDDHNSIFIQNGEQLTHGFNASDLSLGPYRNAVILNTILGNEKYKVEKGITFQTFGLI
jgi:lysine N6-hydroxylase